MAATTAVTITVTITTGVAHPPVGVHVPVRVGHAVIRAVGAGVGVVMVGSDDIGREEDEDGEEVGHHDGG